MKKKESSVRRDLLKKPILPESDEHNHEQSDIHPDVLIISGMVPADIDVEAAYYTDLLRKHQ